MITETTTEFAGAEDAERTAQLWGSIAIGFAAQIASVNFDRGDLAALRRMDPDRADTPTLWRLLAQKDLLVGPAVERKWALILHGIALMTRTNGDTVAVRTAHDQKAPIGRALFYGSNPERTTAFYSPSRFNRLMVARGDMFRSLLGRMFRMMAADRQPFDWYRMAELILNEGYNEERAESERRRIARDYYWAEDRARPRSDQT